MGELDNCSNCGNLYVKVSRNVCPDCVKEEEKKFQTVYDFMKKRINRQATIPEITEGTGVEQELIIKFVKEQRLRSSQFPNLTYPCDKCGDQIQDGKLCTSCSEELTSELTYQDKVDSIQAKNKAEDNKAATYFAVDKGKRKY
ncbi:TIGR03826 family flagellar region protein [Paraliobacillus sediminis]|uniref:TIGR03826 family flagellar region protein n=1 Tax=Paraliobacillus sediminis TaxID=1885916 RepID=UPI000E3C3A6D|nr:TIGR03826 family flagellar region protein [Paraliobacillus sediminis]